MSFCLLPYAACCLVLYVTFCLSRFTGCGVSGGLQVAHTRLLFLLDAVCVFALCSEADAQGRLVPIASCMLPLTWLHTPHACHSQLHVPAALCQLLCAL